MEELLNELIKRGWKPFGFRGEETRIEIERNKDLDIQIFKLDWIIIEQHHRISGSLRNLVSKESGLWQFVCEKKIVNSKTDKFQTIYREKKYDDERDHDFSKKIIDNCDIRYEYRIIESALCDEDKLEEFLLSNIKVDGNIVS